MTFEQFLTDLCGLDKHLLRRSRIQGDWFSARLLSIELKDRKRK